MNFASAFEQGNSVLAAVFLVLIIMSFASWYIIFWKGLLLKKEYKSYNKFIQDHAENKDWPTNDEFSDVSGCVKSLLSEIKTLQKILPKYSDHEAKKEILTMHLSQSLDDIRLQLDKGLTILASISSSAPFIGLFGTVWGIYNALASIALQGNAGLSVVAAPMGEALVATAIGLFAAIPAVLAYNGFVRLNRLLVQNMRHLAEQITVYLSNSNSKN